MVCDLRRPEGLSQGEQMVQTYKAIQVVAPGELRAVELPLRDPPPGHVRIRVEACGVCHTDVVTVLGSFPGIELPRVPGHEVVGKIDVLGVGVSGFEVGQRVGVGFLAGPCGACSRCRRGDLVNCERQGVSGVHTDGGYAEYLVAKANALAAGPPELLLAQSAPLLCAGMTTFTALSRSAARPGAVVAVQGVGGLGHLALQFARRMGFRVVAIARGTDKQELALELGAHHYIDSRAADPAIELKRLGGAQLILATAADNASMAPLVSGLAPRGELIVAGIGADDRLPVHATQLVFGERRVSGTMTGTSLDGEDTLGFCVLQGVRPLIETYPLERAAQAYERMLSNTARFRVVLTMP
jgi:alcohol dehydrogenase, propanol-preferring